MAAYRRLYYPKQGEPIYQNTAPYEFELFFDAVEPQYGSAKGKRLLDYGCGVGHLAGVASGRGAKVMAIEADEVGRDAANASGFCRAFADIASLRRSEPAARFDWIVLWNVIEHLREPWRKLAEIVPLLDRDGMLFCVTPNAASLRSRLLGARWDQRRNPTHFYYFTAASLLAVMRHGGLSELVQVKVRRDYRHHGPLRKFVQRQLGVVGLQGELVVAGRPALG